MNMFSKIFLNLYVIYTLTIIGTISFFNTTDKTFIECINEMRNTNHLNESLFLIVLWCLTIAATVAKQIMYINYFKWYRTYGVSKAEKMFNLSNINICCFCIIIQICMIFLIIHYN